MTTNPGPLNDVVVVDATEGVAGGYAGRLYADLGARVIKVEPPGGDRLRSLGPFPGDQPHAERGGLHLALNAGKESVVADLDTAAGSTLLLGLVQGADVLLESAGPGVMATRGFGERLLDQLPWLVIGSQSPFGSTGPYADRASSEIVDYAMGGYLYFSGDPDRHPLLVQGHQGELHAGMQLAAGTMIALWHARRTGAGQLVDVSTFESMLNAHSWLTTSWTHGGVVQSREPSHVLRCADGHFFWFPRPDPQLFALIERLDFLEDPRMETILGVREVVPEIRAAIEAWAAEREKTELYHTMQDLRLPVTPVNTVEDLANSEQLAARGWWRSVNHPIAGRLELPGPPWTFAASGDAEEGLASGPTRPAPLLDADAGLVLPPKAPPTVNRGEPELPFTGLRVLEVTANWAGPLAGRHLGDLGADVIKIEVGHRPATRAVQHAGNQPRNSGHNRSGYFNLLNRSKRDLVVDLDTQDGREIFLGLVEEVDIVLENNSARVFPNLGLDYATIAARNPRIVMCSMSGMGASGPEMQYQAYGSNIEASSGLVSQLGYSKKELWGTGSYYADPICGTHGLIGMIAALMARERNGRGYFIEMALQESGIIFQTEALMDYRLNGRVAGPRANRSPRIAPQGVYPAAGDDCWLAIGVEDDGQWAALCSAIDRPELAERLPTLAMRMEAHSEIDEVIAAWSIELDHHTATRRLQACGVPAGPVLANWEIVSDPHLFARGYFVDVVHPDVGHYRWDGVPWKLSRTPARVERHAPLFGEHNDELLREAGYSDAQIAVWRESGVVADEPVVGMPG